MQDVARIVLALESEHLTHDVIDYLDRTGRTRVVDTVRDPAALGAAVEHQRPDVVVASPGLLGAAQRLNGSALLTVATEESVRVLREAIAAGARGFFLWPSDREALGNAAALTVSKKPEVRRGRVVAVYGPCGGVGTTFVASHLAAALAARDTETVLVDLDLAFADLTWSLGVPPEADVRTLADLEPVQEEISEDHLQSVLWPHPCGMRALLAPPGPRSSVEPDRCRRVIEAVAGTCEVAIVHVPRGLDAVVSEVVDVADVLLLVVNLDVVSFRGGKRALDELGGTVRWDIVVNRAARSVIVPRDVERVFGRPAIAVIPSDGRVVAAQNRGELMSLRTRSGRAITRLAETLLGEWR